MAYKVVITPTARHQLEMYIAYTLSILKNLQGARALMNDARETKKRLSKVAGSLALCEDEVLAKNGYRKIIFGKHDFFMVYRVDNNTAVAGSLSRKK